MAQQILIPISPERLAWIEEKCNRVEELERAVKVLTEQPELQQWVTISTICKKGLLGGRTKSYEAAKPKLDALVQEGVVAFNTIDKTYNLKDIILFREKVTIS